MGLALLAVPAFADARTFRVNKTADHLPGSCTRADCTLREAVIAANARTGLDTILLRGGRVYGLTQAGAGENFAATGDLDAIDPLVIRPAKPRPGRLARRATIDGNDLDRVFHALVANLTLRSLVVRDGTAGLNNEDGGGIFASEGVLTLSRSVVRGNVADSDGGGVALDQTVPAGSLRIFRSVITGNTATTDGGGGVSADDSTTVIRRSTISANRTNVGVAGGLRQSGGTLTITSSTVSRNVAGSTSGGIRFSGPTGVMTLTNVTVEGNRSDSDGGGIRISSGTASLTAATIIRNTVTGSGDGGGLQEDSNEPVSVKSSIIALNTIGAGTGTNCFSNMGIDSGGHNLLGSLDPACTGFTATGDKASGAPLLGTLRNNGGPTKTACPLKGSPAINAGSPSAPARDQRGRKRVKRPDIGACEFIPRKKRRT